MLRVLTSLLLAAPLVAHALCTSDDVPPVHTLVERFTSADCLACWRAPSPARAPADALVLDWIVPGAQAGGPAVAGPASDDALERLAWLHHRSPATMETVTSRRAGTPARLRIAHGEAFNDYVGVSMELQAPGSEAWHAWLLLVEQIPAGAEGSPVARNLVRKVFRPDAWAKPRRGAGPLAETRSMQVPRATRPDRVRLVSVLQDGRGRIRAITQTECHE
ncbi:hypothetical protein [Ramlibacter alkalitolerans]|uniref:Uncharacterized protein n=1 Tax=Ramlibacter alkalitolerans TaxID=2039631 RepID=A0ABS1JV34_9BURK|nr:hypothetical protein [Ramlibacter alkalitolerans]MBL0428168.1 hypothetical protein [Ramlibacter alkalitolerans]